MYLSLFFKKYNTKNYLSFCAVVLFFIPSLVSAASLLLSPNVGAYEVGDRVSVRVILSSDVSVNAVSGVLSVPTEYFSIESVSKNASILNFWVTEPTFSKGSGTARFEGVALSGFTGSSGTVVTVTLRALKAGSSQVSFQTGQVLANDGQGTDITGNLSSANYSISEPKEKQKVVQPEKIIPEPVPVKKTDEVPQILPTLHAPAIVRGNQFGNPAIVGTSEYSNAQVLLTFLSEDGSKIFITGTSDKEGSFVLRIPQSLKRGYYSVTAVLVQSDGKNTEPSNTITLIVGSVFSDIGWQVWSLIGLLLAVICYLILRIHNHFATEKNINKLSKHELKQAREVLHKSFDVLRDDIDLSDQDKTTVAERKRTALLKKDLKDAEDVIDKEIKDIESL